jgi:hypothetical protein
MFESIAITHNPKKHPFSHFLILFFALKINLDSQFIKLSPSSQEVDHTAWVKLDYINSLTHYSSIGVFKSNLITTSKEVCPKSCEIAQLAPYYPNRIGEGIGEAHWMSLQHLSTLSNIVNGVDGE